MCSVTFFKFLSNNKTDNVDSSKLVSIYERYGNFFNLQYRKRNLDVSEYKANENQQAIIDTIEKQYQEKAHVVAYIHGVAGSGKSLLALLTASKLGGTYCQSFNPTQPGDNLNELYNLVDPSKKAPLVILLDEVDTILDAVIEKKIIPHKHIPISILDKNGWNMFFDNVDRGYYPNIVIIMTSNNPIKYYNDKDPSLLRPGRVNIINELKL